MKKEIIFAFLFVILLAGCSKSNQGTLVMKITDAPTDLNIEKALVTISSVQVHIAGQGEAEDANVETGWTTVVQESKTFDLIKIINVQEFLGSTNLTPGKYTQVRLDVDKALVTIDGTEHDLKLPSRTLKLVHGFTIDAGKTTTLILDFDAKESIKSTGKEGYVINPTIKLTTE